MYSLGVLYSVWRVAETTLCSLAEPVFVYCGRRREGIQLVYSLTAHFCSSFLLLCWKYEAQKPNQIAITGPHQDFNIRSPLSKGSGMSVSLFFYLFLYLFLSSLLALSLSLRFYFQNLSFHYFTSFKYLKYLKV